MEMDSSVNTTFDHLWAKVARKPDERTRGWFLVDSPLNIVFILLFYYFMVWYGPRLMKKRAPFKLKGWMMAYNIFLILLNAHIMTEMFLGTTRLGYDYLCYGNQLDNHPEEMRVIRAAWWFYISKCIEFIDSLFYILREKSDQLSGLHIYHHSTAFPLYWLLMKFYPSGLPARVPVLNSFVHVIMYSYYGLSTMGPKVQKYLWWKRYITLLQLVQFTISIMLSLHSLTKDCNHPLTFDLGNILYMCSFLYLFGQFYLAKYTKKVK